MGENIYIICVSLPGCRAEVGGMWIAGWQELAGEYRVCNSSPGTRPAQIASPDTETLEISASDTVAATQLTLANNSNVECMNHAQSKHKTCCHFYHIDFRQQKLCKIISAELFHIIC